MSKRVFSPLKRKPEWDFESFSLTLLEKEIELEKSFRVDLIEDLITLYSQAIEHYNEISDPKYYDYQDRLHRLLMRPEVSTMINGPGRNSFYSFRKRNLICSEQYIKNKLLQTHKVILEKKIEDEVQKAKIAENVTGQEIDLDKRVDRRRSRKLGDIADMSTKNSYYLDEKEQIEEIMERYYSEKAKEIEEITLESMLKMENSDNAEKIRLADEMKKKIVKVSEKYDVKRIQELNVLKALARRQST